MPRYYPDSFDPQLAYNYTVWEVLRCCLLRTLLSYYGRPTDQGGSELHPDIATAMPDVSTDGLTWTFHLKSGLRYAPPFQATLIVAGDIIRALEREAKVGSDSYAFYYDIIVGFNEYASGSAKSISGLEAPDDRTLVIRLTQPAGDFGYRLALPAAAPIPIRAAVGHDAYARGDYGRFLVASGPYMIEGSEELDPSKPPREQSPVSGFVPMRFRTKSRATTVIPGSMVLVRNPSWERSSDPLRPAYVDRMELSLGGFAIHGVTDWSDVPAFTEDQTRLFDQVTQSQIDMVMDTSPTITQLASLRADPNLSGLVHDNVTSYPERIELNLAVPPLDDIHVREAMNLALDKSRLQHAWFASVSGQPIPEATGGGAVPTHLAPDALEGALLSTYTPPWMASAGGADLPAAKEEMRRSGYDSDGDGICDASVCKHVQLAVSNIWPDRFDAVVVESLAGIGLDVHVHRYPTNSLYATRGPLSPAARTAMTANGWLNDYPNGSTFFRGQFYGPNLRGSSIGYGDFPMLGAAHAELRRWGYSVTKVPTVDDRIQRCDVERGAAQEGCWAELDQYLMEQVVPWIPFLFETATRVVSPRVTHYSFDQSTEMPALDQVALTPDAIAESS